MIFWKYDSVYVFVFPIYSFIKNIIKIKKPNKLVGFFDFNYVFDERVYGENEYIDGIIFPENQNYWGGKTDSEMVKTNFKFGYVDPEIPYRSLGIQFAN